MTAEVRDEIDGVVLALQAAGIASQDIEIDDGTVFVAGEPVADIDA